MALFMLLFTVNFNCHIFSNIDINSTSQSSFTMIPVTDTVWDCRDEAFHFMQSLDNFISCSPLPLIFVSCTIIVIDF